MAPRVTMLRTTPAVLMLTLTVIACGDAESQNPAGPIERIHADVPAIIDPSARYLIYLHGAIIETNGVRPTHPVFGVYEYRKILRTFADRGFEVISEARPAGTDAGEYVGRVAAQVTALLEAGVPPEHVTIVGFSKGGGIAILASSLLANDRLNFVFMASCGSWYADRPDIVPQGRMLGVREASDDLAGSCDDLFSRAPDGSLWSEIVVELGGGHGAFYRPHSEWVDPVVRWAFATR